MELRSRRKGGMLRTNRRTPDWLNQQGDCKALPQCDATSARLEVRCRYRRKLYVRFLSPQHASLLASPIFLVAFPPIDIVMGPKTCLTHALIDDLMRFSSLEASLSGLVRAPFS